ncbi:TetR/AcrR family transcriptional regulator [Caulobacter sp. KR2-114]|uniref:TetR/AcrR family transcriptional regulator n=1 Tax=Caulobacter sp. KR2-114 TaxID=3400912 RepID=UPI003BFF70A5
MRLASNMRRAQLMAAAAELVLAQGHLPAAPERLSQAAGVSKALVYAYFPTQYDLFNALLAQRLEAMLAAGLDEASGRTPLEAAALAAAGLYFDDVASNGPIVHLILRDRYMMGHVSAENRRIRDRIMRRLARAGRRELGLGAQEAVAAMGLIATIPEEAGRLAASGEMRIDRARGLCLKLVRASVAAFRADDRAG